MSDNPLPAPIIIKRIKKGGHAHHGGAWKVAYADFVTAMMAFFLLLWLLNATSSAQKAGIAEYFTPTLGLKDSKGIGFNGGLSAGPEGTARTDKTAPGIVVGQVKQGPDANTPNMQQAKPDPNAEDAAKQVKSQEEIMPEQDVFEGAKQDISQALQEPELKDYQNNIVVQDTPEGLKIDIVDDPQKPMYTPGGAVLTDMGKKVLDSMSRIIAKTPNNITIDGHTDSAGASVNPDYTVWELSTDRANTARRFLSTTTLEKDRVVKVIGHADHELLVPSEPSNARNRRITILVLRDSYYKDPKLAPTTRGLITTPDAKLKKKEEPAPPPPPKNPDDTTDDEIKGN